MATQSAVGKAKGYSIWLVPDPEISEQIAETMATLSVEFNAETFRPHLTLLGQVSDTVDSILPRFKELAIEASPLCLSVESIGMLDNFYRALFYKIGRSRELDEKNNRARTLFARESDPAFFPHISLVYSFASEKEKEIALSRLQSPVPVEISITHMVLMQTQGETTDWKLIKEIELK